MPFEPSSRMYTFRLRPAEHELSGDLGTKLAGPERGHAVTRRGLLASWASAMTDALLAADRMVAPGSRGRQPWRPDWRWPRGA
jgi:hypothetical protein